MLADAPLGDVKVAADSAHLAAVRAQFPDYEQLVAEARAAQEAEHEMTFWQAIRRYPKAIGFSVVISLAIVMEGYDLSLMASFFAQPQFAESKPACLADVTHGIRRHVLIRQDTGLSTRDWARRANGKSLRLGSRVCRTVCRLAASLA